MTEARKGGRTAVAVTTAILSRRDDAGGIDFDAAVEDVRALLEGVTETELRGALTAAGAILALVLDAEYGPDCYDVLQRAGRIFA